MLYYDKRFHYLHFTVNKIPCLPELNKYVLIKNFLEFENVICKRKKSVHYVTGTTKLFKMFLFYRALMQFLFKIIHFVSRY